jgi:hypothetical protein
MFPVRYGLNLYIIYIIYKEFSLYGDKYIDNISCSTFIFLTSTETKTCERHEHAITIKATDAKYSHSLRCVPAHHIRLATVRHYIRI